MALTIDIVLFLLEHTDNEDEMVAHGTLLKVLVIEAELSEAQRRRFEYEVVEKSRMDRILLNEALRELRDAEIIYREDNWAGLNDHAAARQWVREERRRILTQALMPRPAPGNESQPPPDNHEGSRSCSSGCTDEAEPRTA